MAQCGNTLHYTALWSLWRVSPYGRVSRLEAALSSPQAPLCSPFCPPYSTVTSENSSASSPKKHKCALKRIFIFLNCRHVTSQELKWRQLCERSKCTPSWTWLEKRRIPVERSAPLSLQRYWWSQGLYCMYTYCIPWSPSWSTLLPSPHSQHRPWTATRLIA